MRGVITLVSIIVIVLLAHITNISITAFSPLGATIVLVCTYAMPATVLYAWWQYTRRKKREAAEQAGEKGE